MNSIEEIIHVLNLKPHPEGGYFRETYRSDHYLNEDSLTSNYKGKRNYSTCIYFLLTSDTFSAFHRMRQDEIWHFYSGSPIRLHTKSEIGTHSELIIRNDFAKGQFPQLVVPGRYWFGAEVINPNDYSLVRRTVSPGFDFENFSLPTRQGLIFLFPENEKIITKLTKP